MQTTFYTALALVSGIPYVLAQEQRFDADPSGNTRVATSGQGINYGTTPPWYALDALNDFCTPVGCSGELEVGTLVTDDFMLREHKIIMEVQGTFNENGLGTRRNMVEVAKTVSARGYDFRKEDYFEACGSPFCESLKADQYYQTSVYHISVNEDGDDAFLNIDIRVELPDGSDFCEKILSLGADIAGAIGGLAGAAGKDAIADGVGVAGSGFSLASLIC